jgi:hypothetical protein
VIVSSSFTISMTGMMTLFVLFGPGKDGDCVISSPFGSKQSASAIDRAGGCRVQ